MAEATSAMAITYLHTFLRCAKVTINDLAPKAFVVERVKSRRSRGGGGGEALDGIQLIETNSDATFMYICRQHSFIRM